VNNDDRQIGTSSNGRRKEIAVSIDGRRYTLTIDQATDLLAQLATSVHNVTRHQARV
jgi:hypothetical protein